MSVANDLDDFFASEKEVIVSEPLKFKASLGIGERAYALIRARENLTTFTEAIGIGATASGLAGTGVVAGTFFAKSGFMASALSLVGLGAAAATPLGWVIGAGVVSSAAYLGIASLFERSKDTGLVIIPKYINTPMDVIALAIIQFMLPMSLKVAKVDGTVNQPEWNAIHDFFVSRWGYSPNFVSKLMEEYLERLDSVSYTNLAESLTEYCKDSKDCDQGTIVKEYMRHLREVVEADGVITDEEKRRLDYLSDILLPRPQSGKFNDVISATGDSISATFQGIGDTSITVVQSAVDGVKATADAVGDVASTGGKNVASGAKGVAKTVQSIF